MELAILVTSRAYSCQFEWFAHEKHAREAGLPDPVIEAIRVGRRPDPMLPDEAAVYDYALELLEKRGVSDDTHARATAAFGVPGVVELTALVGYYTLLAMTLNAHRIGPPGGEAPLPVAP